MSVTEEQERREVVVRGTEQAWLREPEAAIGELRVTVRTQDTGAEIEAGSFAWQAALPAPLGGSGGAPSPTAHLLGALAGCAAVFLRDTLAPQLGVPVDSVYAEARCRTDARGLLGMGGAVPDLQDLAVDVEIRSPASREQIEELYAVWRERCPVYLALTRATPVTTRLQAIRTLPGG